MVVFGVLTERNDIVASYVSTTNAKLKEANMLLNPFEGDVRLVKQEKGDDLHIVNISPLYFNFTIFGWFFVLAVFFFNKFHFSWLMIPGIILCCLGIFWMKMFYVFIYKKGLRKIGFKGKIKIISNEEVIKLLGYVQYIMVSEGL